MSEKVIKTLDKLGYLQRKLRGRTLHARRTSDHLIIRLSKHGNVESVKAHRDFKRGILFHTHKAVYGKIAETLEAEFKNALREC